MRGAFGVEQWHQALLSEGSLANTFWYKPSPTPESSEGTGDAIFCGGGTKVAGVTVAFVAALA